MNVDSESCGLIVLSSRNRDGNTAFGRECKVALKGCIEELLPSSLAICDRRCGVSRFESTVLPRGGRLGGVEGEMSGFHSSVLSSGACVRDVERRVRGEGPTLVFRGRGCRGVERGCSGDLSCVEECRDDRRDAGGTGSSRLVILKSKGLKLVCLAR